MSQNMINELTDRVNALAAEVAVWRMLADSANSRAKANLIAGQELARTADDLIAENKRITAERNALRAALHATGVHPSLTAELMIEARNNS